MGSGGYKRVGDPSCSGEPVHAIHYYLYFNIARQVLPVCNADELKIMMTLKYNR